MKSRHSSFWKKRAASLWHELDSILEGDVFWDRPTRMLYASDASLFQQLPEAVVRPRHANDCITILKFADKHQVPLIPRAAGTSLAGQCVGSGLVVDVAHYMNQILSFDKEKAIVTVEPGIVLQDLNNELLTYGLTFPIDPSTANRCTIGGMAGNNAWGIHTPRYGTTRDHIVSMDAVLSDGNKVSFSELNEKQLSHKLQQKNREGDIYRSVCGTVESYQDVILEELQPKGVLRSNTAYALNIIANKPGWKKQLNLAQFLCGSEGTLAFMTAITLKLSPLTGNTNLICAHFNSLSEAIKNVPTIATHSVSAIELLDKYILDSSLMDASQKASPLWIEGSPEAVLLIECEQIEPVISSLEHSGCYASSVIQLSEVDKVWALRRAGLAMLMGRKSSIKTISAIEDAAVPLEKLPEYINEVKALMQRYNLDCVYYGPVSVGTVHIRPWMDLSQAGEKQRFISLLKEVASIVKKVGGVISSKHGDGRIRGWLLSTVLDEKLYAALYSIKTSADPKNILNPKNLLASAPPDSNLRVVSSELQETTQATIKTAFDWKQQGGINSAIHQCNGAGVCLKSTETMCPSWQATHNEQHVTRGRANTLRQMFQQYGIEGLSTNEVHDSLELCLSCKGCKKECPAGVDMARLKSEALQQRHNQVGLSIHTRLTANFYNISKLASNIRWLFNSDLFRKKLPLLFGMHKNRSLPKLAPQTFEQWDKQHTPDQNTRYKGIVILINDAQINFYEPHIGIAAVETLEFLGFKVIVSPCLSSIQLLISHGLLRKAKQQLAITVSKLLEITPDDAEIIGLEPSELLTFRDEAPDLLPTELSTRVHNLAKKTYLFEEFILKYSKQVPHLKADKPYIIIIHEHCHQKSLAEPEITQKCLSLINNANVKTLASGCCGMAGSFGYKKEHYELSMKIAEFILFPAIRNTTRDTIIVSSGASCRKQIKDGLGQKAIHPVEVFKLVLLEGINKK